MIEWPANFSRPFPTGLIRDLAKLNQVKPGEIRFYSGLFAPPRAADGSPRRTPGARRIKSISSRSSRLGGETSLDRIMRRALVKP
jgi:hypothetical protein